MTDLTLAELYSQHVGKVSDKWSSYLSQYDRIFREYRDRPVRLLEIGIQNGGSLDIWSRYFPQAESIIGCDINENCSQLEYSDSRIQVVVGDANDDATQAKIQDKCSSFDIVIDDGSHLSSDIVKSFARYFPLIGSDGLFVAEDLHCSYWHDYEGGLFDPHSSIGFFKSLADVINHEHWGVSKTVFDFLTGLIARYDIEFDSDSLDGVNSVEFMNSMSVVRKSVAQDRLLGDRFIVGSEDRAESMTDVVKGLIDVPSQEANFWSAREVSPAEELPQLLQRCGQLKQLNEEKASLEKQLNASRRLFDELQTKNNALLSSISWKSTAPLRFLLDVFGRRRDG